jgi:hypothetical protein
VGVDDVDVFELQSFEGSPCTFNNVLSRETVVVDFDFPKGATPVDLAPIVSAMQQRDIETRVGVTFVLMTRSFLFHPAFLITFPITISDFPPA